MAYVTRYTANWYCEDYSGVLYIDELDYAGASSSIKLLHDAIQITRDFEDWSQHVISTVCEFNIINNGADYFDLLDLMIAMERKYLIRVVATEKEGSAPADVILFSGFVNTEVVTQKYLRYHTIHMVASSYLSKLEYVYPTSLDTIGVVTLIDTVNEILTQAGNTYPIRVNSSLISTNSVYNAAKTFMNQNGIYNEMFWQNNVDRVNSADILENIMSSFRCYMYFWDGYWYIEGYHELWSTSKSYVEYASGSTYMPTDTGTQQVLPFTIQDVHDLVFIETSQTLSVIPGNRTVTIRINNQAFFNLVINDFRGVIKQQVFAYGIVRQWYAFQPMAQTYMIWNAHGAPYKTIVNSIKRTSVIPFGGDAAFPYLYEGLHTTFLLTVETTTSLSIKWKLGVADEGEVLDAGSTITFRYLIAVWDMDGVLQGYLSEMTDKSYWYVGVTAIYQVVQVQGDSADKDNIMDVSINIPLGDTVDLPVGNYYMTLKICTETVKYSNNTTNFIFTDVYYGDVLISASVDAYDENVVEGTTNVNFIKKETFEMMFADVPNYNYKNGVLEGDTLKLLTTSWERDESELRLLVDYILIDKFRLGDISRQRIKSSVKSTTFLRPFSMFTESKQSDKKFMLTGQIHDVTKDEYEVILDEYDNDSAITLNEIP